MTLTFSKGVLFTADQPERPAIDSAALAVIINDCFKAARSGRFSRGQRGSYYSAGVALREQFKVLVGEWFDEGSDELTAANQKIKDVNAELKVALEDIDRAAGTIESLGELVDQLTGLIGLAAPF